MNCGDAAEPVLRHIARYQVTTIDATFSDCYRHRTREAARKMLYRLDAEGYLLRFEVRNRSLYQLTARGCARVGAPTSASRALSAQALIERHAVLAFCTMHGERRVRLTREELLRACPEAESDRRVRPELQHFYLDREGDLLRLGRIKVDSGAAVPALVDKVRDVVRETEKTALARLLKDGAFVVSILTPHETKAERLRSALRTARLPVPVRVEVVAEMKHL